jgi:RNase P subunit RPR2
LTTTCTACGRDRRFIEPGADRPAAPSPGDFWLCPSCGEIHRFTDRVAISFGVIVWIQARAAAAAELAELAPALRSQLLNKRASIRGLA